jgi:predicted nucleic acid-binding protein
VTAGRVFLDTNVVVHASDTRSRAKQKRAQELITSLTADRQGVISTQVLEEAFSAMTRKLGLEPFGAKATLLGLRGLEIVAVAPATVWEAMDIVLLHRLSIWDALLVATAAAAGCATLLTEDLQPGQVLRGVRMEDPFA